MSQSPDTDDSAHDASLAADGDAIGPKSAVNQLAACIVVVGKVAKNDAVLIRKGQGFVQS